MRCRFSVRAAAKSFKTVHESSRPGVRVLKIDRIYTRGGDGGATSLGDGARVVKFDLRIRAMGSVDEANAAIGVAIAHCGNGRSGPVLLCVQNDLFDLGADLCVPQQDAETRSRLRITAGQVEALERKIDSISSALGPLTSFVLPGGSLAAAQLHVARTVVRRAECDLAELAAAEAVNPELLKYLNRLSDLLFVLARHANDGGAADVLWQPGLNR
jgi:cob(I)alamin adenosyltransferase